MLTPSPWATKADVEAAGEALKADIAALHANLAAIHADRWAVQALLNELRDRRPWWRRLFMASAVIAAVMAVGASARADGNAVYELCTSPDVHKQIQCYGYIQGIAEAARRAPLPNNNNVDGRVFCPPGDDVKMRRAVDIVVQFLASHPDLRYLNGGGLAAQALAEAFPCGQ